MDDFDLLGEDGWIVVKKQKVNIFIPPLPSIEPCTVPDLEQGQPHVNTLSDMSKNTLSELPLEKPLKNHLSKTLSDMSKKDDSQSLKFSTQSNPKDCPPADNAVAIPKPSKPDLRRLTVGDQIKASRAISEKQNNLLKFYKTPPKLVRPFKQLGISGVCHLSTSSINLNRHMRALNLERKISSAGGLDRWLSSLGLEQFVGILGAKSVNKFYLANLSMKKLKDMGAHAVGPRRKLIHAIDCVCQPYCRQPSKIHK